MTPKEINEKIAEFCGAEWFRLKPNVDGVDAGLRSLVYSLKDFDKVKTHGLMPADLSERVCQIHGFPNFYDDLNAMYEAETHLSKHQKKEYCEALFEKLELFACIAPASMRAETFIEIIES